MAVRGAAAPPSLLQQPDGAGRAPPDPGAGRRGASRATQTTPPPAQRCRRRPLFLLHGPPRADPRGRAEAGTENAHACFAITTTRPWPPLLFFSARPEACASGPAAAPRGARARRQSAATSRIDPGEPQHRASTRAGPPFTCWRRPGRRMPCPPTPPTTHLNLLSFDLTFPPRERPLRRPPRAGTMYARGQSRDAEEAWGACSGSVTRGPRAPPPARPPPDSFPRPKRLRAQASGTTTVCLSMGRRAGRARLPGRQHSTYDCPRWRVFITLLPGTAQRPPVCATCPQTQPRSVGPRRRQRYLTGARPPHHTHQASGRLLFDQATQPHRNHQQP